QLLLGEGGRAGDPVAGQAAPVAARPAAVLDADDLRGEPRAPERREDAAVAGEVAVVVGGALPRAQGGQVRRLEGGDLPLVHRVVGDPAEPDPAAAPRLGRRPLDALVEVT